VGLALQKSWLEKQKFWVPPDKKQEGMTKDVNAIAKGK
jgi:hypothetical protein